MEVLEALQRALHPFMPFITEEIWQRIAPLAGVRGPTVMLAPVPAGRASSPPTTAAEAEAAWVQAVILGVRQIRGEMNIAPAQAHRRCCCKDASALDEAYAQRHRALLEKLAGLAGITVLAPGASAPESAMALVGDAHAAGADGGADRCGRRGRAPRQAARQDPEELAKTRGKLANESFVRNAPPEVVEQPSASARRDFERSARDLAAQLERMRGMLGR